MALRRSPVRGGSACTPRAVFAERGDGDRAFEWLERAYDRHVGLSGIKGDWALQKIRSDARYAALLKKMTLPPD